MTDAIDAHSKTRDDGFTMQAAKLFESSEGVIVYVRSAAGGFVALGQRRGEAVYSHSCPVWLAVVNTAHQDGGGFATGALGFTRYGRHILVPRPEPGHILMGGVRGKRDATTIGRQKVFGTLSVPVAGRFAFFVPTSERPDRRRIRRHTASADFVWRSATPSRTWRARLPRLRDDATGAIATSTSRPNRRLSSGANGFTINRF